MTLYDRIPTPAYTPQYVSPVTWGPLRATLLATCWRVKPQALLRKSSEHRMSDATGTAVWIVTKLFPTRYQNTILSPRLHIKHQEALDKRRSWVTATAKSEGCECL